VLFDGSKKRHLQIGRYRPWLGTLPTPTSSIPITPPDPGLYQARYHHQALIYGPGHASTRDNRRLPLIFEPGKEGAATAKMLSLAHAFKGQRGLD
jgi:hypothetical protein